MPYILKHRRTELKEEMLIGGTIPLMRDAGELNYILTLVADQYMKDNGENYQHYNDVIGALEGAKLEMYRRRVAPYEDHKISKNGDVYANPDS